MTMASGVIFLASLGLAPLLPGIINRTKALFAGRRGQPLLQVYYELWKLLGKGAVYSRTTTWVILAGPILGLACMCASLALTPFAGAPALFAFRGDLILLAGFLALARFATVLSALDTGSSFEGMGASREVQFAALCEPVLYLALAALAQKIGSVSLTGIYASLGGAHWAEAGPALALVAVALFVVFLAENARIPVDDPTTHLELTMIHEVMVLDHSGPDLAFLTYAATLKHWILGALVTGLVLPVHTGRLWVDGPVALGGMIILAVGVGVVESVMARLRLVRVPQLLVGAGAMCALALVLGLMR